MLRRFLLPLLGVALFATEAATAQTAPAKPVASAYAHPAARPRTLTAREKRAAAIAAKAEAAQAAAVATTQPSTTDTSWGGWSNEPLPTAMQAKEVGNGQHRPVTNVSVAPGMPLNQVGHGVSTDYHGRPLYRTELASTTLAPSR